MKAFFLLFSAFAISTTLINAQNQLVLQPGAEGKDATIWHINSQNTDKGPTNTNNYGNDQDLPAMEWTFSGSKGTKSALIEFDLSKIPSGAIISKAELSLFHSENSGDEGHSTLSGPNKTLIQRVTSEWEESTVTWNTAPTFSTQNEVELAASTSANQDYLKIDVLTLVEDMIDNPGNSFGFMISMQSHGYYRRMIFASGDHPNSNLHPKLEFEFIETPLLTSILKNINKSDTYSIYPNPATDKLIVNTTLKSDTKVSLSNILGEGIYSQKANEGIAEFNLNGLPEGMYLIIFENSTVRQVGSFIKK